MWGKDESGETLVELLRSQGVITSGIQSHPTAPTRQVYTLRSEEGDRSFVGFSYGEAAQTQMLDPAEFADAYLQADKLPTELFVEAEFLIIGTLELAYPQSRIAVRRALELASQYNIKVVVDINWRPIFWSNPHEAPERIKKLWSSLDFLKLSQEEAEWLFETADAGAIAHRLGSVEGVVVSAGESEVSYCLSDYEGTVKPFPIDVQDTTGAGDSFVAGLVHQLGERKSSLNAQVVQEIVTYACAVGGLTATKPGAIAAQPTAAEVEAFLRSR